MNQPDLLIRGLRREELDTLVDWAANEGWNPGLSDSDIFWATDPEGFIAAELDGELVGGGSTVSYDGIYGFMGFFIVHPDHRGRGLGDALWHARRQLLIDRLKKPATIGMDGVSPQHGGSVRMCENVSWPKTHPPRTGNFRSHQF